MGKKTSTVDKAIDIKEYFNIVFDKYTRHDPYLKLSAKNALIKRGYKPDTSGVRQFQCDEHIIETGKIGLEDIENFINSSFHPEKEKPKEEEKKEEIKEKEEESIKNLHINSIINKKDQPSEEEKTNKEDGLAHFIEKFVL